MKKCSHKEHKVVINLSKKKKMKKEIKHVNNTMITKNPFLTKYFEDISRKKA